MVGGTSVFSENTVTNLFIVISFFGKKNTEMNGYNPKITLNHILLFGTY